MINWEKAHLHFLKLDKYESWFAFCYLSDIAISFLWSQSDPIQQLPLYLEFSSTYNVKKVIGTDETVWLGEYNI